MGGARSAFTVFAHAFHKLPILLWDCVFASQVASWPTLGASSVEFAFLIGVGVLLPPAGAAESLFYLQSGLDLCAPFAAIRAHEKGISTWSLVIVQPHSWELEVSALPALGA